MSGYYHIILRGINRQDLFLDDKDYLKFLKTMKKYSQEQNDVTLIAFCLMTNHIHLLIKMSQEPSVFIKKIASSYVYYFNHKYDRVGHLMQDRFWSEPIETEKYLLTVTRYILQNPQKAGLCSADQYPWSSWHEINHPDFCDFHMIEQLAGNKKDLIKFLMSESSEICADLEMAPRINDNKAYIILFQISGFQNPADIASQPDVIRNTILKKAKTAGLSVRQISRLTGINRNIIQRCP